MLYLRKMALCFLLIMTLVFVGAQAALADGEVASVGGTRYETLAAAIAETNGEAEIVLLADTWEDVSISGKELTIDLGGHTLTSTTAADAPFFSVTGGAKVTVKGGTLAGAKDANDDAVQKTYTMYVTGSTLTLDGVTVSGHVAATKGGAIYADNSTVTIQNKSVITGNKANGTTPSKSTVVGDGGGAVYAANGSKVLVDNSTISNNTAISGGGIFLAASTIEVKNGSVLTMNTALGASSSAAFNGGGAIYGIKKSGVTVTDSQITSNTAPYGGAMYIYDTKSNGNLAQPIVITDSNIDKNTGTTFGGGIYWVAQVSTSAECKISGGSMNGNTASSGSAFYLSGMSGSETYAKLTLDGVEIKKNIGTGKSGGTVEVSFCGNVGINDCTIAGNNAATGGLSFSQSAGKVTDTVISGNTGTAASTTSAGGASLLTSQITFNDCRIEGNTSANGAGGINVYSYNMYDGTLNLNGSVVTGNSGGTVGGVDYSSQLFGSLSVQAGADGNGAIYGNTSTGDGGDDLSVMHPSIGSVSVMDPSTMKDGDITFENLALVKADGTAYDAGLSNALSKANGSASYSIKVPTEKFVAQNVTEGSTIEKAKYTSLANAIAGAAVGDTIKLISADEGNGSIIYDSVTIGKNIILQMNGHTLTSSANTTMTVKSGVTVTVTGDGTIENGAMESALINKGTFIAQGDLDIYSVTLAKDCFVTLGNGSMIDKIIIDSSELSKLNKSSIDYSVILVKPYDNADLFSLAAQVEVQDINSMVTVGLDDDGNVTASCKKKTGVFVDGQSGSDGNTGLSADEPVKTFAKAKAVLEDNSGFDGIWVLDAIEVSGKETWDLDGKWLMRYPDYKEQLITLDSGDELTLTNIVLDGNRDAVTAIDAMIYAAEGSVLNITTGAKLQNNHNSQKNYYYDYGGAVYSYGTVNMDGGLVTGNTADNGGGLMLRGSNAVLNFTGGEISGNSCNTDMASTEGSSGGGVGLVAGADMTMSGGEISGNTARYGAGVSTGCIVDYLDEIGSEFVMTGGEIKNNEAIQQGGGIFIQTHCEGRITAGTITGNIASKSGGTQFAGGGIYVNGHFTNNNLQQGVLYLTDTLVHDNTAREGGGLAGCETSGTLVYMTEGAAFYDNTNMDMAFRSTGINALGNTKPHGTIAEYMLGGGAYNWTDENGVSVSSHVLADFLQTFAIQGHPDAAAIAAAQSLGKVHIYGNSTGGLGGGIASNGRVVIGEKKDVTNISVTKIWDDANTDEKLTEKNGQYYLVKPAGTMVHPEVLQVWLLADGERVSVLEFRAETAEENGVTYLVWPKTLTFANQPSGKDYTIVEVLPDGAKYLPVISGSASAGFQVKNIYNPTAELKLEASKTLNGVVPAEDEIFTFTLSSGENVLQTVNNQGGKIAFAPIEYTLEQVGTYVYTVKEVAGDNWLYTYDETVYTITVNVTVGNDGRMSVTHRITNGTDEVQSISFANASITLGGIRLVKADSVDLTKKLRGAVYTVYADQECTIRLGEMVTDENGDGSIQGLNPGTYYVKETTAPAGYDIDLTVYEVVVEAGYTTLMGAASNGVMVDVKFSSLTIVKADRTDPSKLLEGAVYGVYTDEACKILLDQVTTDATGKGTLHDLVSGTYYVKEIKAPVGYAIDEGVYAVQVGKSAEVTTTVTDPPLVGVLRLSKTIKAAADDQQAFSFTITLKADDAGNLGKTCAVVLNGQPAENLRFDIEGTTATATVSLKNGDVMELHGLREGIRYTVTEKADPRYTAMVNGTEGCVAEGVITQLTPSVAAYENVLVQTTFTVEKVWQGGEGGDISLILYANGKAVEPQPAYVKNGSLYTYENLQRLDSKGNEIVYTVKEAPMAGYMTVYENAAPYQDKTDCAYNGGKIINMALVDAAVRKVWTGIDSAENLPAIKLTLYCNGKVYKTATPAPDAKGWYTWKDLPPMVDGKIAVYTVVEEPMTGYTVTYKNVGKHASETDCVYDGGTITNHKVPKTGDGTPLGLWILLAVLAISGMMLLHANERRMNRNER